MATAEEIAGRKLRLLRQEREWSQEEVARRMATNGHDAWHQTTVGKTEAGKRPLRVNELISLAALFAVSPIDLLEPEWELADIAAEIKRAKDARMQVAKRFEETKSELDAATAYRSSVEERHLEAARELERMDTKLMALHSVEDLRSRRRAQEAGEDA